MTLSTGRFPFQLIPRLAVLVGAMVGMGSCAAGEPIESAMGQGEIVALQLAPETAAASAGDTIHFTALAERSNGERNAIYPAWSVDGGSITPEGDFVAGGFPGTFRIIAQSENGFADTSTVQIALPAVTLAAVEISPDNATVIPLGSIQFAAAGRMSDSSLAAVTVSWATTGGSVSSTGLYTAPLSVGSYIVVAREAGGKADTVKVTVATTPTTLIGVLLNPVSATLVAGTTQQFSALGQLIDGTTTPISVNWSATGGTVSSSGRYTAGSTPGTYRVIATSPLGFADTSAVTVAAPTLTAITLSPESVNLVTGAVQQFTVSGKYSNNTTQTISSGVSFTATGGTVTAAGSYTAGLTVGTYRVIATFGGFADTSTIGLSIPAPGAAEPTPSGNIFFDGRAGGAQSFQSVNSLAEVNRFFTANGGVGLEDGFTFTTDYNGTGKHALRIDWTATPNGESGATGTYYYPGSYSRVYVSLVMHLGKTTSGGGNGSIGSFLPVTDKGGMKRFMWLRRQDDGTDRIYWVWPAGAQPGGQKLSIDNRSFDSSWDSNYKIGVDTRFTFELIAGNPGTLRVWENGVLVHSNINASIGTLPFSESQLSTVRFAGQQSESEYWTDLVFWTP